MTKFARIADGEVVEIAVLDEGVEPADVYHRDLAATFVRATQEAQQGWLYSLGAFSPPPIVAPTVELLKAYAANRRWQLEVGGLLVNGSKIATDDRSQRLILGLRVKADANPDFTTRFKGDDGTWFDINAATIIGISDAVFGHVNAAFALEDEVVSKIVSGDLTTFSDIDAEFD